METEEERLSSHACLLLVLSAETSYLFESWGGGEDEEENLMSLALDLPLP